MGCIAVSSALTLGRNDHHMSEMIWPEGKCVGSGALIRDDAGRVLIVKPTYKPGWEIPGGLAETHESPRTAALRELREELGFDAPVGRLLCLEHRGADAGRPDLVLFVFDGGVFSDLEIERIRLPMDELSECRFVAVEDIPEFCPERLANRVQHAVRALEVNQTVYLEDGQVI